MTQNQHCVLAKINGMSAQICCTASACLIVTYAHSEAVNKTKRSRAHTSIRLACSSHHLKVVLVTVENVFASCQLCGFTLFDAKNEGAYLIYLRLIEKNAILRGDGAAEEAYRVRGVYTISRLFQGHAR